MNNKVLVIISIPKIDQQYDVFIPLASTIGEVLLEIKPLLEELTGGYYNKETKSRLYGENGIVLDENKTVKELNVFNESKLILI